MGPIYRKVQKGLAPLVRVGVLLSRGVQEWGEAMRAGRFFRSLRDYSLLALGAAALGVFLYVVGGFSLRGTVAIVFLCGIFWLGQTQSIGAIRGVYNVTSAPYSVWIRPDVPKMLRDLGIVPADWEPPYPKEGLPFRPWTPLHTLHHGIVGIVLFNGAGSPKLIHWTGPNWYTRKLEYSQVLDFLKFQDPMLKSPTGADWSPEFFFHTGHGSGGYEMGIRVLDSWWSDNKDRLERQGIVKSIYSGDDTGKTQITLAILPHKVFYPLDFKGITEQAREKLREAIKKELPLAGWKVEAPWSPEGRREIGTDGEADYTCDYAEISLSFVK